MTDKILAKIKEILLERGWRKDELREQVDKVLYYHDIYRTAEDELMGEDYEKELPPESPKP